MKEREAGLLEAARQLGLPLYFYSTAILGALPVTKPSPNVLERFGIPGVCEPAALAAALGLEEAEDVRARKGYAAELLLPKYALNGVTVAIAIRRNA